MFSSSGDCGHNSRVQPVGDLRDRTAKVAARPQQPTSEFKRPWTRLADCRLLRNRAMRMGALAVCAAALILAGCTSIETSATQTFGTGPLARSSNKSFFQSSSQAAQDEAIAQAYETWRQRTAALARARRQLDAYSVREPKSTNGVLGLARLDNLAGRNQSAEMKYESVMEQAPQDPFVQDAAGQFYGTQQDWQRAVELLKTAAASAPDEPAIQRHLAIALIESGQLELAEDHFIRAHGEADGHFQMGVKLYALGHVTKCREQFEKALEKDPKLLPARDWLQLLDRRPTTTQPTNASSAKSPSIE